MALERVYTLVCNVYNKQEQTLLICLQNAVDLPPKRVNTILQCFSLFCGLEMRVIESETGMKVNSSIEAIMKFQGSNLELKMPILKDLTLKLNSFLEKCQHERFCQVWECINYPSPFTIRSELPQNFFNFYLYNFYFDLSDISGL